MNGIQQARATAAAHGHCLPRDFSVGSGDRAWGHHAAAHRIRGVSVA
jgi:hypothetical protein